MRFLAPLFAVLVLAGCAQSAKSAARVSARQDISALQAMQGPLRGAKSGAPLNVVNVSGTLTNKDSTPIACSGTQFVLLDSRGNAFTPSAQWCDTPSIAPGQSAYFNASFPVAAGDDLQLRFEHSDGSYETHNLIVPPL